MKVLEGRLHEPCIFIDWGDGFAEETYKALTPDGAGGLTAVADSTAGSFIALRFDPSTIDCRFQLLDCTVEPIGSLAKSLPEVTPLRRRFRRILRRAPGPLQKGARLAAAVVGRDTQRRRQALGRIWRAVAPQGAGRWKQAYLQSFDVARQMRHADFAAPPTEPPRRDPDGPLVVAFYLPQFHPIPENDRWWGRGFTEWANVSKAVPQYVGHVQPRLPADLGYYDLRTPGVQEAQAELAALSGVDAFCFHYYWFAGKRLLERPLDDFVSNPAIDLPFALCWANENWTRRWDGLDNAVLIAQQHSPEDDLALLDDLSRYMRSPRYLRIGGRPLLVLYRPETLPNPAATVRRWRERARETGLGELFLLCTNAFGFSDYQRCGFDGLVEFPPHALNPDEINDRVQFLNPGHGGRIFDYEAVVEQKLEDLERLEDPRQLPGVMPAWDNEARKPGLGHVFHGANAAAFRRWTAAAMQASRRLAPPGERLVFVNAWNEWAEGAYLEPDRWLGHGFAQGLRSAHEAGAPRLRNDHPHVRASLENAKRHEAVVLLHLFYSELIEDFAAQLRPLRGLLDVEVTFPEIWSGAELERLVAAMPFARLHAAPNVGRDVAPFLGALRRAREQGYDLFCKLHSKRSPHRAGGADWREALVGGLLGPEVTPRALQRFAAEPRLGLLATSDAAMRLGEEGVLHHNRRHLQGLARRLGFRFGDDSLFPAGTMFWGRTEAFRALADLPPDALDFGVELGRLDGTLAHALERAMGLVAESAGYAADYGLRSPAPAQNLRAP